MKLSSHQLALIALLVLFSFVSSTLKPQPLADQEECTQITNTERYDCYPEAESNAEGCIERGCCWVPAKTRIDVPYCFYPPSYNSYEYLNVSQTDSGVEAFLSRRARSAYPSDIEVLQIIVKFETDTRLHLKIVDPSNERFTPPYPEVPAFESVATNPLYEVDINEAKPGFRILRKSDVTVLFDTNDFINFIYADQFLQISSKLPTRTIYGIGEHENSFPLPLNSWSQITLFNGGLPPDDNINLYGTHPFYLAIEESTNSHGVFLLNSNALDIVLQPTPSITYRTIGGIFDFYFFLGPTPADVVKQYQEVIGQPQIPPYWALGFHLCKYGYYSLEKTRNVTERNIAAGIPLDVQWNDIDYMDRHNDFTYDKDAFAGLPEFVDELHSKGMHYIMIIDPGVSASEPSGTYPPFDLGIEMDIFVKNSSGQPVIGKVWNSESTAFPDFTHPNALTYWAQMLQEYHDQVPFDGVWIDMNEPSNFVDGSFEGCPADSLLDNPPYTPNVMGGVLRSSTLCMSAKQAAGNHYDLHNLYGLSEAIITEKAVRQVLNKRAVVISRSSFAGLGHYAGHWSGDILSDWRDLRRTIPQLLNFGLFGVPLMGSDICGFREDTNEALCNRWQQLGAFYPFSRNHNEQYPREQDPAVMGDLVIRSTIKALQIRYSFLPYLYTLFYRAHVHSETVARALFLEFPDDPSTYEIDTELLWGPAFLIAPVLEDNTEQVEAYLPKALWYDYYTASQISSPGKSYTIDAPEDTIPLFIRGGYILPRQEPKQTTTESRRTNLQLLVAEDENGEATGELYWDDGDSQDPIENGKYTLLSFTLVEGTLRSEVIEYSSEDVLPNLGKIEVWGVQDSVSSVTVHGNPVDYEYDTASQVLTLSLDVSLEQPLEVTWT